jgi:hypothetical protein
MGADLEAWCRFTRNTLVDTTVESGSMRWVIRSDRSARNASNSRLALVA